MRPVGTVRMVSDKRHEPCLYDDKGLLCSFAWMEGSRADKETAAKELLKRMEAAK